MTEGDAPKLTLEAEKAIRAYIAKLVVPSSVVLTIISGLVGYVAGGIATINAAREGEKYAREVAKTITDASIDVELAKAAVTKAASDANDASTAAKNAASASDTAQKHLAAVTNSVDAIIDGKFEQLAESLFKIPGFSTKLATVSNSEIAGIVVRLGQLETNVLAAGSVKNGNWAVSRGVNFDPSSGTITFPNPQNVAFVPIISDISARGEYLTESCYVRSVLQNGFILWQGAQDTSGRNHPPVDCTFAVIGMVGQ
ncbi:hypothetical protein GFM02_05395 [Rhizobium leguminosarum bv. viciae]|uniref:hypothetical protein n=1 Tax=Rhizobium leguminosarum TaxID=384 RepID=UPI001441A20C|nr:hypothetical protein [Rhizobium leguminosarum]NKK97713.1 hypothetical protein [Rhizobium leguminosarum bv. viciae]